MEATKEIEMLSRPLMPTWRGMRAARRWTTLALALALFGSGLFATSAADAATATPAWHVDATALPTVFSTADNANPQCSASIDGGGCDAYEVFAQDVGAGQTDGSPVTLSDSLPQHVTVQSISFTWRGPGAASTFGGFFKGQDLGTNSGIANFCTTAPVQCTLPFQMQPDDTLTMIVDVTVDPAASGTLQNSASASGGGAPDASATTSNGVGSAPPAFGVSGFSNRITGADGTPDQRAGGHPYEMTTRIDLNNRFESRPDGNFGVSSSEDPKDAVVDLPLGLLGSAEATPECTFAQFSAHISGGTTGCPSDTVVGQIFTEPVTGESVAGPIYNMVPERGVAAEFGYADLLAGSHVLYARVVPTPAGYVLRTTGPDIPEVPLTDIVTTFFGDPSAKGGGGTAPLALFTNPSDCSAGALTTTLHVDSWQHPARFNADGAPDLSDPNWVSASSQSPPVTGCNELSFSSKLSARPDTTVADSPSGLDVDIKVPQSEDPNTLATPPLRKAVVTLPQGFTVNPGSAEGLGACSPAQIALGSASSPTCPDSSKIGTLELQSPLLPGILHGSIYLATQNDNPFNALVAVYVVVDDPATGVVLKLPGRMDLDPQTGQVTSTFDNNPQFPFSELKLHFNGGDRGVLATPQSCGTFTTTSAFTPWSAPDSGPASAPSDPIQITSGCVSGFHPSFIALAAKPQAGASSPFRISFSRSDTDEELSGLGLTLPPGLLAKLAGVPLCSDSDANAGTCPADTQVGTVTAGAGPGRSPVFLPGKAYMTGPYKGDPYGIAVVVPAKVGPFDLGNVVVRNHLSIDPTDAHVTDHSDPFPTIVQGIPIRLRRVDIALDRPGFMLNPTSCDPMAITGNLTSTAGTAADVSSRFQVGGCSDLPFAPKLQIGLGGGRSQTTPGKHPSLKATLTQPAGQANIKGVKVALPLSLALDPNNSQHVCDHDAAAAVHGGDVPCPASTIVGTATAVTPLLPHPLAGSVYLVQGIRTTTSGRKVKTLPTLLLPLRGADGVALDLRAASAVQGGKLVTTFGSVPDAPVSSFRLNITGGPRGILTVTGSKSACQQSRVANAAETAQSGKARDVNVTLSEPCGRPHHKRHRRHKHH